MKTLSLLLITSLLFISCDNDDDIKQSNDLDNFLERSTLQFSASLDNQLLKYKFGFDTYQTSISYIFANEDFNDPHRYLRFALNQENGDNQFLIQTPVYNTNSVEEFNNVFGLGPKSIGNSDDDYFLILNYINEQFSICNSDANYQIEVLKTEEVKDFNSDRTGLKVWFKIEDLNLSECNPNYGSSLTNGLIIAKFYGYQFE